jgi:membrane protease YdiL (CAAX protease family)
MRGVLFGTLMLAACGGIVLSFRRPRARAALAEDRFPSAGRRTLAFFSLGAALLLTVVFPFAGGFLGGEETSEPGRLSLVSLFGVHAILAVFLAVYYLCSGRRSLPDFLRLGSARPASDLAAGVAIGGGVWFLNFLLAAFLIGVRSIVTGGAPLPGRVPPRVSPMIVLLIHQPVAVRIAIVVSAMLVEELFFRSFLQTRVGPVAATLMFTAAHAAYGQPLLLIWILVVSTVLSAALALYRNVLPCIVAHGVFDAIQMFVVIPFVLRALDA